MIDITRKPTTLRNAGFGDRERADRFIVDAQIGPS
jgi:hypothetical protein